MKNKKLRSVFIFLLILQLTISSLYPFFSVYAREAEDASDAYSYSEPTDDFGGEDTQPGETQPAEEPQEEDINTLREEQRDIREGAERNLYVPGPTAEPTEEPTLEPSMQPTPIPTPEPTSSPVIITSSTAQERAMDRYEKKMEKIDKDQDEVYTNTRADQQGTGADATYAPSKIGNMAQNQIDKAEEKINEIAESTIPKTREEILQDRRLEQKEEQLNKITQQADKEYQEAEKQRKEALQAAMVLKPEQRITALNTSMGLPQDTPPEKTLMLFNNSAKALGVKVDVRDNGSYTITLENEPSPPPALTYTPYVPGSSFAPASISASSTIDPKPLCDHIKDSAEKDKCENEWRTIAVGGTVAVTAAGAAIVSAPVWLPAAGAGLSTAASIISTSTTAMYVYPTVAGGVLLSRLPAIVQQGIGVLAQASSVVIPSAVWASCQTQDNPVDCVSKELGMADLPTVIAQGTKALSGTKAVANLTGGADVAVDKALELAGANINKMTIKQGQAVSKNNKTGFLADTYDAIVGKLMGKGTASKTSGVEDASIIIGQRVEANKTVPGYQFDYGEEALTTIKNTTDQAPLTVNPQIQKEAPKLAKEIFGRDETEEELAIIAQLLEQGVNKQKILEWKSEAEDLHQVLIQTKGMFSTDMVFSNDINSSTWSVLRHNSGIADQMEETFAGGWINNWDQFPQDRLMTEVLRANAVKAGNLQQLTPLIHDAQDAAKSLADYAISNGANPQNFAHINQTWNPDKFYITDYVPRGAAALKEGFTNNILIGRAYTGRFKTIFHECIHRMCTVGASKGDSIFLSPGSNIENELKAGFSQIEVPSYTQISTNANKLDEGLTEWVARKAEGLTTRDGRTIQIPSEHKTYQDQVEGVEKIVGAIMQHSGLSRQKAEAVVIEAAMSGDRSRLIESAGGAKALFNILETAPEVGVKVKDVPKVITPLDIAVAKGNTVVELNNSAAKSINFAPLKHKPFSLLHYAYATEEQTKNSLSVDAETFDLMVKKRLIKDTLREAGYVDNDYIQNILRMEITTPKTMVTKAGYLLITGKAGTVEGQTEKGKYLVEVSAIPDLNIKVPSYIDLSSGDVALGIAIKEGSGKVEKVGFAGGRDDIDLVKSASAQEATNSAKVKVVVFADNNGNGVYDNEEKVLPWAGVQVKLTKVDQGKTVSLNAGWNLVSLTALPNETIAASNILKNIGSQGGQATTVSTLVSGDWKSFVIRGDKTYSGDDFAIVPGKAYFIKALKPSAIKFTGQNLVAPVKLALRSGWNAIGVPQQSQKYTISTFVNKLNSQKANSDMASRWESGFWDSFVSKKEQTYGNDFPIEPNRGYIIKVAKDTEFSP